MSDGTSSKGSTQRILLGQISSVHGIKGHVLVRTFSAEPEGVAAYGPLENKTGDKTFALKIVRVTDKGVVASIAGIIDRTAAEALRGTDLYIARSKLPDPADGEYYHSDLIGLDAADETGALIGKVIAVQNYGAGDLLEIKRPGDAQTELIPLTNEFVPSIDLERRIAVIIPPRLIDGGDGLDGLETE
jgi:16S rRNA processing protein RimM